MKHLFYVHSGITYLVALAVCRENRILADDVAILFSRGFYADSTFKHYKLATEEIAIAAIPTYGGREVVSNYKRLRDLDIRVNELVNNNPFTLYVPSERNYLMQYLQTHKKCIRRNFIEEGLLTYHNSFAKTSTARKNLATLIKNKFRLPFHLNRSHLAMREDDNPKKNFTVFVCTPLAGKMLSQHPVQVLDIRAAVPDIKYQNTDQITHLFIFDPVAEKKLCDIDTFIDCLKKFVTTTIPEGAKVHVKFHPEQQFSEQYLNAFSSSGIEFSVLDKDVVPEVLLLAGSRLTILGLSSSVLFYARQWQHIVKTFSPALAARSAGYKNWVIGSIPKTIIDSLQLL